MEFYESKSWSSNIEDIDFTDDQWKQWDKTYSDYFETIVNKLPKNFVKQYYKNSGFHDFVIRSIKIENLKPYKSEIKITLDSNYSGLELESNKFMLVYYNVTGYSIHIPSNRDCSFGFLQWLLSEFYLQEDNFWTHRIMCDGNCELKFVFKRLGIKKV